MTCPSCADAERNPRTGSYRTECIDCSARALAHSPIYHEASARGRMTQAYSDALRKVAGDNVTDRENLHRRVKAWVDRIDGIAP
jgi:hypothetical protein